MSVNCMDINIIDLQGNELDINSIHVEGNDIVYIVVKKDNEDYITRRKARELIEEVNEQYR